MMYVSRRYMKLFTVASILLVGTNASSNDCKENTKLTELVFSRNLGRLIPVQKADKAKHGRNGAPPGAARARPSEQGMIGYLRIFVGLQLKEDRAADIARWGCSDKTALEFILNGELETDHMGALGLTRKMMKRIDHSIEEACTLYLSNVFKGKAWRTPAMLDTKEMITRLPGFNEEEPDLSKCILWRPFDYKINTIPEALATRDVIEQTCWEIGTPEQQDLVKRVTDALRVSTGYYRMAGKDWNVSCVACRGPFCDVEQGMTGSLRIDERAERAIDEFVGMESDQILKKIGHKVLVLEPHASLAKDMGTATGKTLMDALDMPIVARGRAGDLGRGFKKDPSDI